MSDTSEASSSAAASGDVAVSNAVASDVGRMPEAFAEAQAPEETTTATTKTSETTPATETNAAPADPLEGTAWEEYGLPRDVAEELHKIGMLDHVHAAIDKRLVDTFRQQQAPPEPQQQQVDPRYLLWLQQQQRQRPRQQGQQPGEPNGFKIGLDPELYPELVPQLEALQKHAEQVAQQRAQRFAQHYAQQVIEQEVRPLQNFLLQQRDNEYRSWIDGKFKDLGAEYEPIFGTGTWDTIDPNSDGAQYRAQVWSAVADLMQIAAMQGRPVPKRDVLFERAVRMIAGDHTQQIARKAHEDRVRDTKGRFLTRPTNRQSVDHRTPEQRAIANYDRKLKELGVIE